MPGPASRLTPAKAAKSSSRAPSAPRSTASIPASTNQPIEAHSISIYTDGHIFKFPSDPLQNFRAVREQTITCYRAVAAGTATARDLAFIFGMGAIEPHEMVEAGGIEEEMAEDNGKSGVVEVLISDDEDSDGEGSGGVSGEEEQEDPHTDSIGVQSKDIDALEGVGSSPPGQNDSQGQGSHQTDHHAEERAPNKVPPEEKQQTPVRSGSRDVQRRHLPVVVVSNSLDVDNGSTPGQKNTGIKGSRRMADHAETISRKTASPDQTAEDKTTSPVVVKVESDRKLTKAANLEDPGGEDSNEEKPVKEASDKSPRKGNDKKPIPAAAGTELKPLPVQVVLDSIKAASSSAGRQRDTAIKSPRKTHSRSKPIPATSMTPQKTPKTTPTVPPTGGQKSDAEWSDCSSVSESDAEDCGSDSVGSASEACNKSPPNGKKQEPVSPTSAPVLSKRTHVKVTFKGMHPVSGSDHLRSNNTAKLPNNIPEPTAPVRPGGAVKKTPKGRPTVPDSDGVESDSEDPDADYSESSDHEDSDATTTDSEDLDSDDLDSEEDDVPPRPGVILPLKRRRVGTLPTDSNSGKVSDPLSTNNESKRPRHDDDTTQPTLSENSCPKATTTSNAGTSSATPTPAKPSKPLGDTDFVGDFLDFNEARARTGKSHQWLSGKYVEGLLSLRGAFAYTKPLGGGCERCRVSGAECRVLYYKDMTRRHIWSLPVRDRRCGACMVKGWQCHAAGINRSQLKPPRT